MSTRSTAALVALAAATVASVATSPARWEISTAERGDAMALDASEPVASMHVDVEVADIPGDAYGDLAVTLTMGELTPDEQGDPATLDFVLVQETPEGDVELDAVTGWTYVESADDAELVHLSAGDIDHESATYRVDATLVDGAGATFDWGVYVAYELRTEDDVPGEPSLVLTLDPAAPAADE